MKYVCEAPGGATWFRIETQIEADAEAALMSHAVDTYFRRYNELARAAYRAPAGLASFEQAIGLTDFVARTMPVFLTLRADDGEGLATAMLPPQGRSQANFTIIVVGPGNDDPYKSHAAAIAALGAHYKLSLKHETCYPYARTRG
jgi:hypothetical protein